MTVKTWTFAYNTTPEDQTTAQRQAASLHKQRKDFLVAGGWTVTRSSDGDAGRTDFSGDNVTDVATDYIWSATNARTWMELKSPEGFWAGLDGSYTGDQSRMWVTVHLNSADVYNAEIYFHNVSPTGTADATHCPTSTNKIGYAAQQMLRSTFDNGAFFHFARTSEGSWLEFITYPPSGYAPWFLVVLPITNPNHNSVFGRDYPFATGITAGWSDLAPIGATAIYVSSSVGLGSNANCIKTFYSNGSACSGHCKFFTFYTANSGHLPIGISFSSTTGDAFSGTYPTSPFILANHAANKYSMIGTVADIYGSYAPFVNGDVDSVTPTRVFLGQLVLPTDTTINL